MDIGEVGRGEIAAQVCMLLCLFIVLSLFDCCWWIKRFRQY